MAKFKQFMEITQKVEDLEQLKGKIQQKIYYGTGKDPTKMSVGEFGKAIMDLGFAEDPQEAHQLAAMLTRLEELKAQEELERNLRMQSKDEIDVRTQK